MIGKIILTQRDIGYLHVLDYYLHLASKELAAPRWNYWFDSLVRYTDGEEGDIYS